MNKTTFNREELYELVWSKTAKSILEKYDISNVDFQKLCKSMEIPVPKSGYWQKVQYGKSVSKEPLYNGYNGKSEVSLTHKEEGTGNTANDSPLLILQKEIENDYGLSLKVTDKLTNPDKLIVETREKLKNQNPSIYDRQYLGLIHTYGKELNIGVSPANLMRALCFMDVFIKLLHKRGHEIVVESGTYVIIDGERLEISLREKLNRKKVPNKSNTYEITEYIPSGVLCFRSKKVAYHNLEWKDGKLPIEKQLSKILAGLEIKVKELKAERIRIEKYWEEMRRKEQIQKDLRKQKEDKMSAFKELLNKASRWHQSITLRNYINEIEKNAIVGDNLSNELQQRLEWTRKMIDWYDPMVEAEDGLLRDYNRDTLEEVKNRNSII